MELVLIIVFGALMHASRTFAPSLDTGGDAAGTALAFGFLLLTAFFAGGFFKRLGLPRLTGYLATGVIAGPEVLGLLTSPMVADLRIFNGAAVAMIALTAGLEMELHALRPLLRTVGWITGLAVVGTTALLAAAVFFASPLLPFMGALGVSGKLALALVLGVTMVAQSPAVVVALRDEMDAEGPMARTVLAVVVIGDLVVILLFAIVSSIAQAALGGGADIGATARKLAWEIVGSAVAGLAVGGFAAGYLKLVRGAGPLFVVMTAFVVAEVGQRVHFDPLLIALAAGMLIRNVTSLGDRLHTAIEAAALPVYVVFFAVAGATIHVHAFRVVGVAALLFCLVRAIGFLTLTPLAARKAGAPPVVRRWAGFGMLPQAGLALALAILFSRTFPSFGADAGTLVFGVVATNELLAPILYRWALVRSGEAGQRSRKPEPVVAVSADATLVTSAPPQG